MHHRPHGRLAHRHMLNVALALVLALAALGGGAGTRGPVPGGAAQAAANRIAAENRKPGTTTWRSPELDAFARQWAAQRDARPRPPAPADLGGPAGAPAPTPTPTPA